MLTQEQIKNLKKEFPHRITVKEKNDIVKKINKIVPVVKARMSNKGLMTLHVNVAPKLKYFDIPGIILSFLEEKNSGRQDWISISGMDYWNSWKKYNDKIWDIALEYQIVHSESDIQTDYFGSKRYYFYYHCVHPKGREDALRKTILATVEEERKSGESGFSHLVFNKYSEIFGLNYFLKV